jgi:predicted RNase H-related nuclease YkuK (DUF458 family)
MISIIFLSFEVIEMRKGLTYMLLGIGVGMGALAAYQQYTNGNMTRAYNKIMNKAQKSQENMM